MRFAEQTDARRLKTDRRTCLLTSPTNVCSMHTLTLLVTHFVVSARGPACSEPSAVSIDFDSTSNPNAAMEWTNAAFVVVRASSLFDGYTEGEEIELMVLGMPYTKLECIILPVKDLKFFLKEYKLGASSLPKRLARNHCVYVIKPEAFSAAVVRVGPNTSPAQNVEGRVFKWPM